METRNEFKTKVNFYIITVANWAEKIEAQMDGYWAR